MTPHRIKYLLSEGDGGHHKPVAFSLPLGGTLEVYAKDRVDAYAQALSRLERPGLPVTVTPGSGPHPLDFTDEELHCIQARELPLRSDPVPGSFAEIRSIKAA